MTWLSDALRGGYDGLVSRRARLVGTVAVLAAIAVPAAAQAATSAQRQADRALQRASALYAGPASSPDPREATLILRDLVLRLDDLSPAERARAESLLARPDDGAADPDQQGYSVPAAQPLCSEHFCLHWVATSHDAPAPADTNANGLPDQVDLTSRVLEEVWQKEVVEYGYRPPKADDASPNHGPDGRIDIYLADIGDDGIYGFCTTDDPTAASGPNGPWDVSAYCVLDNDYTPSQFVGAASGAAALQVTAAHEFFHAIQFGYDFLEDGWILEGTAVWMEDEVYDDVDDNYQYLEKSPLSRPDVPLDLAVTDFDSPLGGYQYGAFVFWRFLSEQFGGPDVIRRTWEFADGRPGAQDQYSLKAVDSALRERGSNVRAAFARFGAANAHPASFYEEGAGYPAAPVGTRATLTPRRQKAAATLQLDHLTTWYGSFRPGPAVPDGSLLRLTVDLPPRRRGGEATLIVVPRSGDPKLVAMTLDARGDGTRTLRFSARDVQEVELVLSNASGRFRCWERLPLVCQGQPLDDSQPYRYEARILAPR